MEAHHETSELCSTPLSCALSPSLRVREEPSGLNRAATEIPHLRKQGDRHSNDRGRQAVPVAGGELGNNTPTSLEYMKSVWPRSSRPAQQRLGGLSWAHIERRKEVRLQCAGRRDQGARAHNLRLVLLWFGSWKNGESTYAPTG